MTIKCYDFFDKNFLIREIDMPILDHKNEKYIKEICAYHPYYKVIKIHLTDKNICHIESLTHYLIQEAIKTDIKMYDSKMLTSMYKHFKTQFTDLTLSDFRLSLHEVFIRFNTVVNSNLLEQTDSGLVSKEFKEYPFHKYLRETSVLSQREFK